MNGKKRTRILAVVVTMLIVIALMPVQTAFADLNEGVLYVGGYDIVAEGGTVTGDGGQGTAVLTYDGDGNPVLTLNNYKCESCTGGSNDTYYAVIQYKGVSKFTIQTSGENAVKPADGEYVAYGIDSNGPLVIKGDGTLIATSTQDVATKGISCGSDIRIESGNITAIGGDVSGSFSSRGIQANGSVTIVGGTVEASGGNAGPYSYGIYGRNGVEITGGVVTARSGNASYSEGIFGDTTIGKGITRVEIAGATKAVQGTIKNAVPGTGWDEIEDGGSGTKIDVDTSGRALSYKKVLFEQYAVTVSGGKAYDADGNEIEAASPGETVTITADTPEQGKAFVQWAHVEGVDFDNASSTSTTFTMPAKDVTVTAVTAPIVIQAIADKVYTGESIEPFEEARVSLQGVDILLTNNDYEVSFEDNLDAGDAKVIVTMKSPLAGSAETTFKILPADISTATVETAGQEYTGGELRPNPTVTWNGKTLQKDKDYTLSYTDNVNVGTATVTVTGKGNFDTATFVSGTFEITKPEPTPTPTTAGGILMAKLTAKGSNGLTLSWNEINGAEGYDIFFVHCGKNASWKLEKTIKDGKTTTWTKTGLTKKSAYKAYVKAWVMKDGKKSYVSTSPVVHAYTSGCTKKYTNPKSVTVKKTSVSLKKGKTYKIKASVKKLKKGKKLMPKSHAAKLRYKSSDTSVATVSSSGKIKAKGKGTCYIYVYAVNGVYKKVKVTVK